MLEGLFLFFLFFFEAEGLGAIGNLCFHCRVHSRFFGLFLNTVVLHKSGCLL